MARTKPEQINFRCTSAERKAYDALSSELDKPLTSIIREKLNALVNKYLGPGHLVD